MDIYKNIFELYETNGWENQQVFDDFLMQNFGKVSNKILAAGIVSYRRAREATLVVYPNVNKTLIELIKMKLISLMFYIRRNIKTEE